MDTVQVRRRELRTDIDRRRACESRTRGLQRRLYGGPVPEPRGCIAAGEILVIDTDVAIEACSACDTARAVLDAELRSAREMRLTALRKAQIAGSDATATEMYHSLEQQLEAREAHATRLRLARFELEPSRVRQALQQPAFPPRRGMTGRRSM